MKRLKLFLAFLFALLQRATPGFLKPRLPLVRKTVHLQHVDDKLQDNISLGTSESSAAPAPINNGLIPDQVIVDLNYHPPLPVDDPARVTFAPPCLTPPEQNEQLMMDWADIMDGEQEDGHYPFAVMLQASAPYIASHAKKIAVFHVPGSLMMSTTSDEQADHFISDLALAWLLGLKVVLVVGCRYDNLNNDGQSLRVTDGPTLRHLEEEAGYLRGEIERKLNRLLRKHQGGSTTSADNVAPEGNVMSGNFYTARQFGAVRQQDFGHAGFCTSVHVGNILNILNHSDDVVLLTTIGMSQSGDLVDVNGYHLAASVAAALQADKLIFMAEHGTIPQANTDGTPILEIPDRFAQKILRHHAVQVHYKTGFATFAQARQLLEPHAVEWLIQLGWATWALHQGVTRGHIVHPTDGALLEELFTAGYGVNTCLYHDDEDAVTEDGITQQDWDDFFAAQQQPQNVNKSQG